MSVLIADAESMAANKKLIFIFGLYIYSLNINVGFLSAYMYINTRAHSNTILYLCKSIFNKCNKQEKIFEINTLRPYTLDDN